MGGGSSTSNKKKFTSCYMLSGELGKGAFSVVKLGINKVGISGGGGETDRAPDGRVVNHQAN